jgi:hypothetical protein
MDDKESLKQYMLKEVDIIQDIIKRMAFNSFMIKGWAITLVVVALLLKGTEYQVWIAFIPLLVFWIMFSITLGWFYGSIAILIVVYSVLLFLMQKGGV